MSPPSTEQDLAKFIQDANGPLKIVGGGTRDYGRPVDGDVLNVSALSGITLYEPGALTLVAGAGTPLEVITSQLDKNNQQLAFEPMDHRGLLNTSGTPTIGGAIAANVSGPRRITVGAARDFLLGVRFVDGKGQVVKNGGRVMKNVTGYDLVKLMAGSFGTIGVLTEVSLKVLPKAEREATLCFEARNAETAIKIMSQALGSAFDVTGAAFDAQCERVSLRLEGFENSVAYRIDKLSKHLEECEAVETLDHDASQQHWRMIRDVGALQQTEADVWRISVKPSDAPELIDRLKPAIYQLDWGGGLVWVSAKNGEDLRSQMGMIKGHATLVRASLETRNQVASFHPELAPIAKLSNGLRQKFDPRSILNPGLMD